MNTKLQKERRCKWCQISELAATYYNGIERQKYCVNEKGHEWIEDKNEYTN